MRISSTRLCIFLCHSLDARSMAPPSGVPGGLSHPGAATGSQGAGDSLGSLGALIFLLKPDLMFSKMHRLDTRSLYF